MCTIVEEAGIIASYVPTRRTPVTVTISAGGARSSIRGGEGEREADLDPDAITDAWDLLGANSVCPILRTHRLPLTPASCWVGVVVHRPARPRVWSGDAGSDPGPGPDCSGVWVTVGSTRLLAGEDLCWSGCPR
jgi:hypothetical protein